METSSIVAKPCAKPGCVGTMQPLQKTKGLECDTCGLFLYVKDYASYCEFVKRTKQGVG